MDDKVDHAVGSCDIEYHRGKDHEGLLLVVFQYNEYEHCSNADESYTNYYHNPFLVSRVDHTVLLPLYFQDEVYEYQEEDHDEVDSSSIVPIEECGQDGEEEQEECNHLGESSEPCDLLYHLDNMCKCSVVDGSYGECHVHYEPSCEVGLLAYQVSSCESKEEEKEATYSEACCCNHHRECKPEPNLPDLKLNSLQFDDTEGSTLKQDHPQDKYNYGPLLFIHNHVDGEEGDYKEDVHYDCQDNEDVIRGLRNHLLTSGLLLFNHQPCEIFLTGLRVDP